MSDMLDSYLYDMADIWADENGYPFTVEDALLDAGRWPWTPTKLDVADWN